MTNLIRRFKNRNKITVSYSNSQAHTYKGRNYIESRPAGVVKTASATGHGLIVLGASFDYTPRSA